MSEDPLVNQVWPPQDHRPEVYHNEYLEMPEVGGFTGPSYYDEEIDDMIDKFMPTLRAIHGVLNSLLLDKNNTFAPAPPTEPPSSTISNHVPKRKHVCSRWSQEEHERFLTGLKEGGKGRWKTIARDFVKTRSAVQIASHAQKYFNLRRANNHNKNDAAAAAAPRKKRLSIHDTTTDHLPAFQPMP